jgi:hypothetical protein
VNFTTKEKDELTVTKRWDRKEGYFVELGVENDSGGVIAFFTPEEAVQLGNALIKAAQPKQKKEGHHGR